MAINKINWPTASSPTYTPDIETDYNAQNENLERVIRGYNAVTLTNWDNTTAIPEVKAGSVIESNGVLYDVTTDTNIDTSVASAGTVWLCFDDYHNKFIWSNTVPTWSAGKNGWYIGTYRATLHRAEWDGSTSWTEKKIIVKKPVKNDEFLTLSLPNGATYLLPRGDIFVRGIVDPMRSHTGDQVSLEFKGGGTWELVSIWHTTTTPSPNYAPFIPYIGASVKSDGESWRIRVNNYSGTVETQVIVFAGW